MEALTEAKVLFGAGDEVVQGVDNGRANKFTRHVEADVLQGVERREHLMLATSSEGGAFEILDHMEDVLEVEDYVGKASVRDDVFEDLMTVFVHGGDAKVDFGAYLRVEEGPAQVDLWAVGGDDPVLGGAGYSTIEDLSVGVDGGYVPARVVCGGEGELASGASAIVAVEEGHAGEVEDVCVVE